MPEPFLKALSAVKGGLLRGLEFYRRAVGAVLLTLVYFSGVALSSAAHRSRSLFSHRAPAGWIPAEGYGATGSERQS